MIDGLTNMLNEIVKDTGKYEVFIPNFEGDDKIKVMHSTFEQADRPLNEGIRYTTRNEGLEGKTHPETGVPFERKIVENSNGELVEVVVPKFESKFDVQLSENLYEASDKKQFDECNRQLKEAVEKNKDLRDQFTEEQLEQIEEGDTPDGYVWHHDAEKGKMQLVDEEQHRKTGHTGGKNIWGGGSENR